MSPRDAATSAQIASALKNIIEDLGYTITTLADGTFSASGTDLVAVAQLLSDVASKSPPWTRSYMHHALNGRQGSKRLYQAIITLGAQLDGHTVILANVEKIEVLARPGQLHPQSIILADAIRCQGCRIAFVPRVPWQKYCSAKCRRSH